MASADSSVRSSNAPRGRGVTPSRLQTAWPTSTNRADGSGSRGQCRVRSLPRPGRRRPRWGRSWFIQIGPFASLHRWPKRPAGGSLGSTYSAASAASRDPCARAWPFNSPAVACRSGGVRATGVACARHGRRSAVPAAGWLRAGNEHDSRSDDE